MNIAGAPTSIASWSDHRRCSSCRCSPYRNSRNRGSASDYASSRLSTKMWSFSDCCCRHSAVGLLNEREYFSSCTKERRTWGNFQFSFYTQMARPTMGGTKKSNNNKNWVLSGSGQVLKLCCNLFCNLTGMQWISVREEGTCGMHFLPLGGYALIVSLSRRQDAVKERTRRTTIGRQDDKTTGRWNPLKLNWNKRTQRSKLL